MRGAGHARGAPAFIYSASVPTTYTCKVAVWTILDRYLGWQFLRTSAQVLVALCALFIVIDLSTHTFDNVRSYNVPWRVVMLFYAAWMPTVLFRYQVFPFGLLVATLWVLGRAVRLNEVTAALASGISAHRIARSVLGLGALLSMAAFVLNDVYGSRGTELADRIEQEYFGRGRSLLRQSGISWANLQGGWTCHIVKFNRVALSGADVYLHNFSTDMVQEIRARRIYWDPDTRRWMLEDGRWFEFDPKRDWEQRVSRITQQPAPFTESPETLFALEKRSETKSVRRLWRDLRYAETLGLPTQTHWVDFYVKFAQPFAGFVMVMLAVPFAFRLGKGGLAVSFGVSLGFGMLFALTFYAATGLGYLGKLPPYIAAGFANALFLCIGAWFYGRMPT